LLENEEQLEGEGLDSRGDHVDNNLKSFVLNGGRTENKPHGPIVPRNLKVFHANRHRAFFGTEERI
jgi:hypothetical protein